MKLRAVAAVIVALGVAWLSGTSLFAQPGALSPAVFQTRPGQFEIIALDPDAGPRVTTLAATVWQTLMEPLALPTAFSSSIVVRLVPAARWTEPTPFRTVVEAGGVVTVLIGFSDNVGDIVVRRALVQGLLMRVAVALHGVNEQLAAPLWLEHACVGWSRIHERASLGDAWQQEAASLAPAPLSDLLEWQRGQPERRAWEVSALALLMHLMAESSRAGEWAAVRHALLNGADGMAALENAFRSIPKSQQERECWWQTGYHHHRRAQPLPSRSAADSRAWLGETFRVVLSRDGRDVVLSLEDLFVARGDRVVEAEIGDRVTRLERELPRLHPFYRNAALSLGRTLLAVRGGDVEAFTLTRTEFTRDLLDGRELEDAANALLDGR